MIIKLIGQEISLTAANTINDARAVRIFNSGAGLALITRRDDANTIIGTCTLAANSVHILEKHAYDTFSSNVTVLAASIAFTN
jgi:phosphoribosylaminoimidazole (AIR) synthetase